MLRVPCWAVLLVAAAASCTPTHRIDPGAPASIAPADADVWAWEADVGGDVPSGVVSCIVRSGSRERIADVAVGRWSARIALGPGDNAVRAECRDARHGIHASATAHLRGRLRDAPTARIVTSDGAGGILLDATATTSSGGSHAPITRWTWSVEPSSSARIEGEGPRVRLTGLPAGAAAAVALEVEDARGAKDVARTRIGALPAPRDAVVYGVVPPLFGSPPLRAVREALPDLADLGASVLWLAPIFETTPGDYGYAVTDYFRVRSDYGSVADLADLVADAHRHGLRVVLDMVPNHTSEHHRYFQDARARGSASRYFAMYQRGSDGREPVHYFDWAHLPNLDYENPEVGRFILEATAHWMREARVDGYRVDAAWGIQQRTPSFWGAFREEARRIDPDALLVAEASARDRFWRDHGFDAAYDWTDELGHWAWEDVFGDPDAIADRLDAAVNRSRTHVLRFLENNDTGERFVTRHGPDLTRVAAAALLTLPGTPSLFTGQERGAEYEPYARRSPLAGADPHDLRPWYRSLIALRRSVPALAGDGYVRAPVAAADPRVLAYVRSDEAQRSIALVALRFDGAGSSARVTLPRAASSRRVWRDALDGTTVAARDGALDLELAPWSARVLVADP